MRFLLKNVYLAFFAIGLITSTAFASYFYLQSLTERDVRDRLLEQHIDGQIDNTRFLASSITSDLDSITSRLEHFAYIVSRQETGLSSVETTSLLKNLKNDIGSITTIDFIDILDQDGKIVNIDNDDYRMFVGTDVSERDYVSATERNMESYVSAMFKGLTGKYYVAISSPIIDPSNGQYMGLVAARFLATEFFEEYGNVYDFGSASIVAFDREGNVLSTFVEGIIGENYYSEKVQDAIGYNEERNAVFTNVMSGKPDSVIFTAKLGERLVSGYPVHYKDEPIMTVFITTPTAFFYSRVGETLAADSLQNAILLGTVVSSIGVLVAFLVKWNSTLDNTVRNKTKDVRESNESLSKANVAMASLNRELADKNLRLEAQDKLQQEFINIAAHELRTPVQPIVGMMDLLGVYPKKAEEEEEEEEEVRVKKADLRLVARNARRLERLSQAILDVAKIESQSFTLDKTQPVKLDDLVLESAEDARIQIGSYPEMKIAIEKRHKNEIFVDVDRARVAQVFTNLLDNAINFTIPEGTITIIIVSPDRGFVNISIKDSGKGIASEITPRLFEKFASQTDAGFGNGLGLYISKAVIEAHGGRIQGKNNPEGGATFSFTLPVASPFTKNLETMEDRVDDSISIDVSRRIE
jgi:signal transduction histidine kinase